MTHPASGNSVWQDYPNTETLISAAALERIEAALDQTVSSAWVPLTLTNSWVSRDVAMSTTTFFAPSCRLLPGSRVEMVGTIYRASGGAASGDGVATVPVGYRPSRELTIAAYDNNGYTVNMIVRPTGFVVVSSFRTTGNTITFGGAYPINGPT